MLSNKESNDIKPPACMEIAEKTPNLEVLCQKKAAGLDHNAG